MRWLYLLILLAACSPGRAGPSLDPGLERRIAQKKAELQGRPDDAELWAQLGDLQNEGKLFFEAAESLMTASERGAPVTRTAAGLATAYLELGYMGALVEQLKKCFEVDRMQPDCTFVFAELLMEDNTPQTLAEARRAFGRFLAAAPANHPKINYARSALEQLNARLGPDTASPPPGEGPPAAPHGEMPPGHPPPAGDHSQQPQIPGHPTTDGAEPVGELNPFGRAIQKAMAAAAKGDGPGAEAGFREAVAISPKDPGALSGLAEILHAQGKMAEARQRIEEAWAAGPKDPQVRYTFGLILIGDPKRRPEAIAAWEALLAEEPEYAQQLGLKDRIAEAKSLK